MACARQRGQRLRDGLPEFLLAIVNTRFHHFQSRFGTNRTERQTGSKLHVHIGIGEHRAQVFERFAFAKRAEADTAQLPDNRIGRAQRLA